MQKTLERAFLTCRLNCLIKIISEKEKKKWNDKQNLREQIFNKIANNILLPSSKF